MNDCKIQAPVHLTAIEAAGSTHEEVNLGHRRQVRGSPWSEVVTLPPSA